MIVMVSTPELNMSAEIEEKGFAFVSELLPKFDTETVAKHLGYIEKLEGIAMIQELVPKSETNAPPNIYSGNFGFGDFPFHTDLAHWHKPPRFLLLRCIRGAKTVATRLIDSRRIIDAIGSEELRRTLVQPRRPMQGKRCMLRILEQCPSDRIRFRWDSLFIQPSSKRSAQVFANISTLIADLPPLDLLLQNPGDILLVDNWRMLHGRSAVSENERDRIIHRAYLSELI